MTKKEIKEKDDVWKEKIRKRDKRCIVCEGTRILQADHVFSSTYHATRWLTPNGVLLCRRHHIFWKRSNPVLWYWAVEKKVGRKKLKELYNKILEKSRKLQK